MSKKNLVLIGFMGTGKSSVGKALAKRTGRALIDVDQRIEEKEKRRIADIFEKDGEVAFRRLEKDAIREAAKSSGAIITTGGGAVIDPENLSILKVGGVLVALEASPETIFQRVKDSRHRPLLHSNDVPAEIRRLLEARRPYYQKADLTFVTDGKSAAQVAEEIAAKLASSEEFEFGKDWF